MRLNGIQQPLQYHKYNTHCNTNKNVCILEFCMYFTNITITTSISWNKAVHSHVTCRLSPSGEANRPQLFKDSLYYLQPENSLPCSQEQTSFLYPESDESSPAIPPTPLLSILTLSHHMCIYLPSSLFSSDFTTTAQYLCPPMSAIHATSISCSLIKSP